MHQSEEQAKLLGRKGKPEAYYFPPQYNETDNDFPYTFMGLTPGTAKEDVRRCLEKRPEERFRTAHDLAIALEAVSSASIGGLSSSAIEPPSPAPAPAPRRLAERALLFAAGALLAAGGMLLWSRLHAAPPAAAVVFRWASFSGRDSSPDLSRDGRTMFGAGPRRSAVTEAGLSFLTTVSMTSVRSVRPEPRKNRAPGVSPGRASRPAAGGTGPRSESRRT